MNQEIITINIEDDEWEEIPVPPEVVYKYKDKYLSFVRSIPSTGAWEMRYCDEKENVLPDSPIIIRTRQRRYVNMDCGTMYMMEK